MLRVSVILLALCWAAPALAQQADGAARLLLAQHGNLAQSDNAASGHALDHKDPIAAEDETSSVPCAWTGDWSKLPSYLACRTGIARAFRNAGLALALLAVLLALALLLIWYYLRRAAKAAELAASYIPTAERAYVFGGPTDLALSIGEASVRLAMQNCGKTPALLSEWSVEFMSREPRSLLPAYDLTKRTPTSEVLEPNRVFSPAAVYRSDVPPNFFIVGYIKYKDVFQKEHVTRFCVGVSPNGNAAPAGHAAWNAYD